MAYPYRAAHRVAEVVARREIYLRRVGFNSECGGGPNRSRDRTPRRDCARGFQSDREQRPLDGLDGGLGATGGPRPQFDTGLSHRPGPLNGGPRVPKGTRLNLALCTEET